MKKIARLFMAMLILIVPIMSVWAITGNYFVYTKGDVVNFYYNDDDKLLGETTEDAGRTTIIINDEGSGSQYVKTLVTGLSISGLGLYYEDGTAGFVYNDTNNADSPIKTTINWLNQKNYQDGYIKDKNEAGNIGFITVDELIDTFGAVENGTSGSNKVYKIDPSNKIGSKGKTVAEVLTSTGVLTQLKAMQAGGKTVIETTAQYAGGVYNLGFYTGTTTEDGLVYAVDITLGNDDAITAIDVKPVEIPAEATTNKVYYSLIPTAYFDKTYDCTNKDTTTESACYLCDDEYVWSVVGEQADTCKVVEKITDESKCVKPVETGIEDYLPELIGVLAIGGIAIMLIKRKDLFKSI